MSITDFGNTIGAVDMEAFSILDLAKRMGLVPAQVIHLARRGYVDIDQMWAVKRFGIHAIVSRDAAVVLCITLGFNPMKVMA
ncbi:hypothetical protein [Planctomycetes bacterium TBK1r]